MSITLTSSAKSQLRQSVADREKGIGVRVGVKRTGCSGLAYLMEYVDALADEDEVYQFDDVKLVIDKKSLIYLKGTELDYVKNGLNEGFEFKNPNVKNECGCGRSPTGLCIGWHNLSETDYKAKLAIYEERKKNKKQ